MCIVELDLSDFSDKAIKIAYETIDAAANNLLNRADIIDHNTRTAILQAALIIDAILYELAGLAFADEGNTND